MEFVNDKQHAAPPGNRTKYTGVRRFKEMLRRWWTRIAPIFKARPEGQSNAVLYFNYQRIWKAAVMTAGGVSIVPLIIITVVDYNVTQHAIESEFLLRAARVVSNERRSIEFFISERRSALEYIVRDNGMDELLDNKRLQVILENLSRSFGGGFVDLGIIDQAGTQRTYVGPFDLSGRNYADQPWFQNVAEKRVSVSDVFLGYRHLPHMVIAIKGALPNGGFYVLRASIGIEPFERLLSEMELSGQGDAFMINHEGILQTSSRYYGRVLESLNLPVPRYSDHTEVMEIAAGDGTPLIVSYRFLEDTPFILMVVKNKTELLAGWQQTRLKLIIFLIGSLTVILTAILGTVTFMVSRIYEADQRRMATLHHLEYSNKMASIGRMAAGVAHEINNPLAIINEKAGLIKDLFVIKQAYGSDPKLIGLVDAITASVKRAGGITKRLLTFSRNLEADKHESVDVKELVHEVLSFLGKEAQNRGVAIQVKAADGLARLETHRGKLQQIILNIINNAMAAVPDCGRLAIDMRPEERDHIIIDIIDNGHGIAKEDLPRIFEPFFSTKTASGGTGLGLSITYNLAQELGGRLAVESEIGRGTKFSVILPLKKIGRGEESGCVFS